MHDRDIPVLHSGVSMPVVANGIGDTVKVRLREMSGGHGGLAISRVTLVKLAMKCKSLRELHDARFAATSGPFVSIRTELFRILLYWADAGRLLFARNQNQELYMALKACGATEAARKVKQVGALKNQGSTSKAQSKARKVAVHPRARDCRRAGARKNMSTFRKNELLLEPVLAVHMLYSGMSRPLVGALPDCCMWSAVITLCSTADAVVSSK